MRKGFEYTGVSVVTMCHDGAGKYVMEHRTDKCRDEQGVWSPVGCGGVKFGESLEAAVAREVLEECGATATEIEPLGYREVFREHEGEATHWIAFDFRAKVDPRDVRVGEPEKCDAMQWCTIDTIPKPLHSQFPYFLKKYKDKL